MADIDVPVLIVGGGGAGLTASMLLSQLGVDSLLVSALPTTLVTTTITAPRSDASFCGARVSAVSPDWLTLMTSVLWSIGGGE